MVLILPWFQITEGNQVMLRAGTNAVTGKRALDVYGDPLEAEFDETRLFEQATHMGVPKVILENYLDKLRDSGDFPAPAFSRTPMV